MKALRGSPRTLFDATAAGATLSKLLFPGTYTCTLPGAVGNDIQPITSSGSTIGGVIAPDYGTCGLLLDFCAVGAADVNLVVELGMLSASGALAIPLASVSLKTITTSGTVANVNPYTGVAAASTTFRLFDLAAITAKSAVNDVITVVGGTEDDTPCRLCLNTSQGVWYYGLVTNLNTLTRAICLITPAWPVQAEKAIS